MDASTLSGEETQATQIINAVLPQHAAEIEIERQNGVRQTQVHDGSSRQELASSSSQNGNVPQYHHFGLASTQTDSQGDGAPAGGGSQKENAPTSCELDNQTFRSPARSHSPGPSKRSERDIDTRNPTGTTSTAKCSRATAKSSKPIPLPVPQRQTHAERIDTTSSRDAHRSRRRRSPSPASQDSFAGPLPPEEAQKAFVANTRVFHVPLSELQESNVDDAAAPQTPSSVRTNDSYSFRNAERRVPLPPPPRPMQHTGAILVAETPSSSSRSNHSQSVANQTQLVVESPSAAQQTQVDTQPTDESQPHAQPRDSLFGSSYQGAEHAGTQVSSPIDDISTEPSSSYERVLGADLYAPNPEAYAATQLATQTSNVEATQPAGATQDAGPSVGIDRYDPFKSASPGPSVATTSTRTVGRGLAGLIPQHRRWQYQMEGADSSSRPARAAPSDNHHRVLQITHAQDTQPSDTNAVHGSAATDVPRRQLPLPQRRRLPSPVTLQEADIVPDSEPMDMDAARSEPGRTVDSPSDDTPQPRPDLPVEEVPDSVMTDEHVYGEDEEDDVPLAVRSDKGKQKVSSHSRSPTVRGSTERVQRRLDTPEVVSSNTPKVVSADVKPLKQKGRALPSRSRDTSAAPSSKASEITTPSTATRARPGSSKRNGNKAVALGRGRHSRPKSRSRTPALALKQRRPSMGASSDDATAVSKDTELILPGGHDEGDTELADDDYMDDDDDPLRLRPSAAKRKRVTSVTSKGVASKTLARGGKTSNTPLSRSAKKRKVSSSAIVDDASSATRVYALWRQDNHYYSGTVYLMSSVSPPRYEIHFDDGTQDVVDITKMRLCKLLKGDNVLVLKGQKAVVVDVSRFDSDRVATVEIDNGEELDRLDLEVQDIRIASRTLNSAWTNRTLAVEDVCPVMRPHALKNSPSPSKMALGSAASTKSARRLLGKTGFVVTMSPRVDEWEKEKDKIMQAIKGVGGIVIDNWTDVFAMEGALSQSGKRWIAKYDDIRCVVRNDIQRVFLLSDDYNAKPKYLIALALGIPCLDTSWVLHSVGDGQEKDWQQYLLPAGLCESLDTRVSQLVDFDWGNSVEYLRDVTGNQAALRLFAGKRVLCLAPDYVPVAKSRRNNSDADKAKEATRMVPCIILAMGASSVEAVPDVKYASAKNLSEYHYVVVKDRGDIGRVASGPNCVHFGWVKDCLIAGRLLPLPQD